MFLLCRFLPYKTVYGHRKKAVREVMIFIWIFRVIFKSDKTIEKKIVRSITYVAVFSYPLTGNI